MPPALTPQDEDEAYDSAADSDFAGSLSASSGEQESGEDERKKAGAKSQKGRPDADGDLEMGSGDEGVIAQGRKRKKKKKGKGKQKGEVTEPHEDDENDGITADGIRVRLRSGRGGYVYTTRNPASTTTFERYADSN